MNTTSTSAGTTRSVKRIHGFAASTVCLDCVSESAVENLSICPKKCPIAVQSAKKFSKGNKNDTPKGATSQNDYPWDWTPRQYLVWALMWETLPLVALFYATGVM